MQDPLGPRITMLAEHDLLSELVFTNPNGHIPSSQFEISMHFAALGAGEGKLTFLSGCRCQTNHSGAPTANSQKSGGDGRDRTDDLMLAKQLLSQLSYVP